MPLFYFIKHADFLPIDGNDIVQVHYFENFQHAQAYRQMLLNSILKNGDQRIYFDGEIHDIEYTNKIDLLNQLTEINKISCEIPILTKDLSEIKTEKIIIKRAKAKKLPRIKKIGPKEKMILQLLNNETIT